MGSLPFPRPIVWSWETKTLKKFHHVWEKTTVFKFLDCFCWSLSLYNNYNDFKLFFPPLNEYYRMILNEHIDSELAKCYNLRVHQNKLASCTSWARGTLTQDWKRQNSNITVLWTARSDGASTKVFLSCLWNATRATIHQAVCIFCIQQREFAAFCCLSTRSRKDGEEGTICHSITRSCGRPRSVNKTPNKSAAHKEAVWRHQRNSWSHAARPALSKSSKAVFWYFSWKKKIPIVHVRLLFKSVLVQQQT